MGDSGTLSWVKNEIDLALGQAAEALARHAAAPDEAAALAEARTQLHQACGALGFVGLPGVMRYAACIEARLAALADAVDADRRVAVCAAIGAALQALRRHLDALAAGHPDQPLSLYPAYRALASAAGLPEPAPLELFYPDLTCRPPERATSATELAPSRRRALRLGFARGLAKWRAGEKRGLLEMRNAIASIEQGLDRPDERTFWWVALAWLDAGDPPADRLLENLDKQLAALAGDGAPPAADALLTEMLYAIALAPPGSEHLENVRRCFRLADLIPAADQSFRTQRENCRAPLATAMAEWESFSQGAAIALMRFHEVARLLAATARDGNDPALARLAAAIAELAAWLRQQPERADAPLMLEVAGALVLVEDAIAAEGSRSPATESIFTAEVDAQIDRFAAFRAGQTPAPPSSRWREQMLVAQVAGEMLANLDAIEPALNDFFRSPQASLPPAIAAGLHQIAGALRLLGEDAAAQIALAVEAKLSAPDPADFSASAERLAALGQFAASLAQGQPERELLASLHDDVCPVPPAAPSAQAPAPGAQDEGELLEIFLAEAREVLAALATAQAALAADPADRAALKTLRRGFHTLKGSGRMVGLQALAETARAVEQRISHPLDAREPADDALLSLIEAARALFARWIAALETGQPPPDPAALFAPDAPQECVDIGALQLSAARFRLYVEEAADHLATLRRELAGGTTLPSHESIRAARTLADISVDTGFAAVGELARALENVLVRHARARATPDENARMLLARAVGSLEGMFGAIAARRPPAEEAVLGTRLHELAPDTAAAPPADEIDPQFAALFLEEADEQLRQIDATLRAWRAAPAQADIGRRMVRLLHTFKGDARMCGAMDIGALAHDMEARIEQALAGGNASPAILDDLDVSLGRAAERVASLRPAPAAPAEVPAVADAAPATQLRVSAELIDRLVSEAGELAISRSRIEAGMKDAKAALLDLDENVARLRGQLREFEMHAEAGMQSRLGDGATGRPDFDPLELDRFTRLQELTRMMAESVNDVAAVQHALRRQVEGTDAALQAQARQNRELSRALLDTRMVPFTAITERLHHLVRQTARELGRQASLRIRGGDTPLDRHVLERMLAPLEHLLRNALAHGIEPPAARVAAGKQPLGKIVLDVAAADNHVVLTLVDDGAGLDLAAIRRRAVERGLLAADAPADDALLADLVFHPGLSTAPAVSALAGRGIGLDVVRSEVTQLGGRVAVGPADHGKAGGGTRFEIALPLTLAVVPVMLVAAGGCRWAIPAALVEEVHALEADEAAARRTAGGVTRNGRHYAWHGLAQLFGLPASDEPATWQLLLKSGSERIALEVAALAQNQEVVAKPVGAMLARVPGITGATLLPDGSVALIVNPVALSRRAGAAARPAAVLPAPTFAAPTVMIVDDSLTVRKITGRLLERAGYRVMTARDGSEALEQIETRRPDVMLADIEMPRMDGFELVRALRADARLADIPVIMITSRIAAKHRRLAEELGVRHYLGKPYDEDALLALVAGLLKPV